eukprot:365747-Chlamydomonas_euryale.AAC.38
MGGHAGDGPAQRNGDETQTRQVYTCRARRFAVKFSPPCIFLEYEDASKKMRVREVSWSWTSNAASTQAVVCSLVVACYAVKLTKVVPDTEVDKLTRKV